MREWIVLIIIICIICLVSIAGVRKKNNQPSDKTKFYLKDNLYSLATIFLIFIIAPLFFTQVDFQKTGKGILIEDDILSPLETIFYIPFFISLLKINYLYPKDILSAKEVFGYPVQFMPDSRREYFIFCLYVVIGVVYEELLCRQFAFRAFNETLHLQGDVLLVVTAIIFGIGHLYQGWKGVVSTFILGLILGKVFQMTENIMYPIVLHLMLNMTILSLAYRRIKDLKKVKKQRL